MEDDSNSQAKKITSNIASDILDDLGYSARRRSARIAGSDKSSAAYTISSRAIHQNDKIDTVYVGSYREGIALSCESDVDILQVNNGVTCTDKETVGRADCVTFQLIREDTPEGYALLKLCSNKSRKNEYLKTLKPALVHKNGHTYLSSEKYMYMKMCEEVFQHNGYPDRNTVFNVTRKGPSIPRFSEARFIDKLMLKWFSANTVQKYDFVRAFPCVCPDLQAWCSRDHNGDWPSPETIQQISRTQAYVVPVGKSGSPTENLEWRISLIQAEICLVRSLNDTQAKVLILLRYIGHHHLTPICADITSYIMKNVIFWLAESCPKEKFQTKYLLDRLEDALRFLSKCIMERKLANYMFPAKNLFEGKLQSAEQEVVNEEIKKIIGICTELPQKKETRECIEIVHNKLVGDIGLYSLYNVADRLATLQANVLTVQQQADYNIFLFHSSSYWKLQIYHYYKVLLPMIWHLKWPLCSFTDKNLPQTIDTNQFPLMSLNEMGIQQANTCNLKNTSQSKTNKPWKQKRSSRRRRRKRNKHHKKQYMYPKVKSPQVKYQVKVRPDRVKWEYTEKVCDFLLIFLAAILLLCKIVREELGVVMGISVVMCIIYFSEFFSY